MVSPAESSNPTPNGTTNLSPIGIGPEINRDNPLDSTAQDRTISGICRELLTQLSQHSGAPITAESSTEFQDLQNEVANLIRRDTYPEGLGILKDIAASSLNKASALISAAALLNRLYDLKPTKEDCWRIERLVQPEAPIKEEREQHLRDLGRLAYRFHTGRPQVLDTSNFITLLERGMAVLRTTSLPPEQHVAFVEALGALGAQQSNFRGIQSIRGAIERAPTSINPSFISDLIIAGISVGHLSKLVASRVESTATLVTGDPQAVEILSAAVAYQASQGGSIIRLIDGFSKLYKSYPINERQEKLAHYRALIDHIKEHRAPIDLVSREIVDQFSASDPKEYTALLAEHVAALEEIADTARLSGRLQREQIVMLRSMGAVGPNPELIRTLKICAVSLQESCHEPEAMIRNLDRLNNELQLSRAGWADIEKLLSWQIPKNRPLDQLIQRAVDIKTRANNVQTAPPYWDSYMALVEALGEEVPDLAVITPDMLDDLRRNPSPERFAYMRDVALCADQLTNYIPAAERSTTRIVRDLLKPNGLGEILVRAVVAHRTQNIPFGPLFESYLDLQNSFPSEGLPLFRRVVDYQISNKLPLGHLFQKFSEMGPASVISSPNGRPLLRWEVAAELMDKLMARNIPLEFLGEPCVAAYLQHRTEDKALEDISHHLSTLHKLSIDSRSLVKDRGWQTLLAAVADLGPRSPGPAAIEMLISAPEDGGEVLSPSDVVKIASLPATISSNAWTALGRSIQHYRNSGQSLERLCSFIFELDRNLEPIKPSPDEAWKALRELMFDLREANLPYDLISAQFIASFQASNDSVQGLLTHFLRGMTRFHEKLKNTNNSSISGSPDNSTDSLRKLLNDITSNNYGLTDNPAMVHKLNLILAEGRISSLNEFHYVLRELKMHALTDTMRNSSNPMRRDWARQLMAKEFNMGGPPYVQGSPDALRHFNDSMQLVDRAFRDSKGFGGFALDSRGIPRCKKLEPVPPMLVRFGLDVARRTCIINSSSNESFPGKGLYIGGIDATKVFTTDPRWRERGKSSAHWRWLEEGGFFGSQYFHNFTMKHFENTAFLNMRGLMCVMPPQEKMFTLDGTHYCYLVYNRHFYPGTHTALGVPSIILMELLGNSLLAAEDFRGFEKTRTDLSKVDFSFMALLAACDQRKLNLLDLTYGSVIGGGLCNAYLPKSLPHYRWERDAGAASGWTDSWGHVHKSFREGSYSSAMRRTLDEALQDARNLHRDVYNTFRPMQDYLSAFRFALSFYKMGQVLVREEDRQEGEQPPEGSESEFESGEEDEDVFGDQEVPVEPEAVHEYQYRMLEEIYRWHLGMKEQGWAPEQMPILYFAWVLDPNSLPPHSDRKFEIDLASMTIKTRDGSFHLPRNGTGTGEQERELWREHIIPHFGSDSFGWEPRLLLRDGAFTIHE